MNDEEQKVFDILPSEKSVGITFVMKALNIHYYFALSILHDLQRQGLVEEKQVGNVIKYRKIGDSGASVSGIKPILEQRS